MVPHTQTWSGDLLMVNFKLGHVSGGQGTDAQMDFTPRIWIERGILISEARVGDKD